MTAVTDSIADLLTRIRNAGGARMESVDIPHSLMKEEIVKVLKNEGFIAKYEVQNKRSKIYLRVTLKYKPNKSPVITGIKRASKPGRRVYTKVGAIPRLYGGFGTVILTTPKGIMTDSDAREAGVGGEILAYVW